MNGSTRRLPLYGLMLVPAGAQASDFSVLTVAGVALAVSLLLAWLGVKAVAVSRRLGRREATVYLLPTLALLAIGLGVVVEEAEHLSRPDYLGLLALLLAPPLAAALAVMVGGKPTPVSKDPADDGHADA